MLPDLPDRTEADGVPETRSESILVIKLGAFGDVIQADGALRDLRACHPDAELVVLTTPTYRRLFERCPHVDRVMVDRRAPAWNLAAWLAMARTFAKERFAVVYDLQKQDRTALYRRLFFRRVRWSGTRERLRKGSPLDGFAAQLVAAGVPVHACRTPDVAWMADDLRPLLDTHGVRRPFVALIPGSAARHPQKRWPYFAELAEALHASGFDTVTVPGPDEMALCRGIPGHVLTAPAGHLDWFALAGVLREAAFVVGNDTGPSHLACHLGRPGLALFGPHGSPEATGLDRRHFGAIQTPDWASLTVDAVRDAVLERLASVASDAPDTQGSPASRAR